MWVDTMTTCGLTFTVMIYKAGGTRLAHLCRIRDNNSDPFGRKNSVKDIT